MSIRQVKAKINKGDSDKLLYSDFGVLTLKEFTNVLYSEMNLESGNVCVFVNKQVIGNLLYSRQWWNEGRVNICPGFNYINNQMLAPTFDHFSAKLDGCNPNIVSVGCGVAYLERQYMEKTGKKVYLVDPDPTYFQSKSINDLGEYKMDVSYVNELINKHPNLVGNCTLVLIKPQPEDDGAISTPPSYDVEAIKALKPKDIIFYGDIGGSDGSTALHKWFHSQNLPSSKMRGCEFNGLADDDFSLFGSTKEGEYRLNGKIIFRNYSSYDLNIISWTEIFGLCADEDTFYDPDDAIDKYNCVLRLTRN